MIRGPVTLPHISHRGDAVLQALALGFQRGPALLVLGVLHLSPQPEVGVTPDHAGEPVVHHLHLIRRILGRILRAIDPQVLQSLVIIHADVAAAVHTVDRMVRRGRVQFLNGGMTPLGKQRGLIAHHRDPPPRRDRDRGLPDHLQHGRQRRTVLLCGIDHAAGKVRPQHSVEDGVKMGVVEAGHQRPSRQVIDLGMRVNQLVDLLVGANENDLVSLHAHGLGDLIMVIHRDDAAVFERDVQIGKIKIHRRPPFHISGVRAGS